MATFDIYNQKKEKVGALDVADAVFSSEVKPYLFWEVVKCQLASRRAGTAKAKTRSEMRGGGQKPFRQKGTGRARQGTTRAPHMVGGSVAHGPQLRDYSYKIPKKVRRQALCSALSLRASESQITIFEDLDLPEIKTKALKEILDNFEVSNALIIEEGNDNLKKSCRNLAEFQVMPSRGLNVYDILRYDHLILTRASAKAIEARLGHGEESESDD